MGNPVTWFEIVSKDAKKARDFYSEVFGWSMKETADMKYVTIDTGSKAGIQGGLVEPNPGIPLKGVTFYIEVDDPAALLKKAEKHGGKTALPAFAIPNGPTVGLFADPDGNIVGVVKTIPRK